MSQLRMLARRRSRLNSLALVMQYPSQDGYHSEGYGMDKNLWTTMSGSFGGLIPSPHLLGMVGDLGNLDNLFQKDRGLLQHKLEVVFKSLGYLPPAEVGEQQHVDLLDSCLAVPEEGLVLQMQRSQHVTKVPCVVLLHL